MIHRAPRLRLAASALALMLVLSGCAGFGQSSREALEPFDQAHLIAPLAFYPQTELHCGPAALATVLDHSGLGVDYAALVERVYLPGRGGTLQVELLAATRSLNRIPWVLQADARAVLDEVVAGRPVLVLENQGLRRVPFWHYAVVIGFDPERQTIIQHSGTEAYLDRPMRRWLRDWHLAGRWALITLPPGQLPLEVDQARWLQTLADFEAVAEPAAALTAWQSTTERWPDIALAWLGQGNSYYRLGNTAAAIDAFERALQLNPDQPAASFNLAWLLLAQDEACAAMALLDGLREHPGLQTRVDDAWSAAQRACADSPAADSESR
ncbi:MAG: PA2778 family cysteine peptidase [Wenzhouxiangella sp.]